MNTESTSMPTRNEEIRQKLLDVTSEGRPQDDLVRDLMVIVGQERNYAYLMGRDDARREQGAPRVAGKTLDIENELVEHRAKLNTHSQRIDGIHADLRRIFDVLTNDYTARHALAREWMEKSQRDPSV